jgi:hypothetical protein
LAALSSGVSVLVLALLTPVFIAGIMIGAAEFERGRAINVAHLFAGFRPHGSRLIALGGFYLLGQVATFWMMRIVGGDSFQTLLEGHGGEISPAQLTEAMPQLIQAMIVGFAVTVPILMAMIFAAPLVALANLHPVNAMATSLRACVRNLAALILYGMAIFGLFFFAALPFTSLDSYSNPAPWIIAPVILPSLYIAYRDIFAAQSDSTLA